MTPFEAKVVLFFPKIQSADTLKKGDILLISTRLSPPSDNGNPDSFDYARYLHRRGIGGTGYIRQGRWKVVGHIESHSLADQALRYREHILRIYQSLHWDKDILSIVSALTVGYKDELSSDIRETYSITGASHVLALSGLHIGILYGMLFWLMRPLGNSKRMDRIRGLITIILLWAFAFFTGLSPSVIRSVIMFSLFAIARALRRNSYPLNTLSAAAFFMLLICPEWLFDISFQLSFCAVATLLLFEKHIERCYHPHTWLGKKMWQLTAVSLSAQLGTAPLIIYYFSRFSVYFILSGFIVIPLASLIMFATIALLLSTPFGALQRVFSIIVSSLVDTMNNSLRWIEKLPYSSIDGIWIYPIEMLCCYLLLALTLCYLHRHRPRFAYSILLLTLAFIGLHHYLQQQDMPRDSIAFYNVRSCPAVHCISSNRQSWLVCASDTSDVDDMQRMMVRHWNHLHLFKPDIVKEDMQTAQMTVRNNIISYQGKRIGIVSDNRWRYQKSDAKLRTDYLYICRGYKGKAEELLQMFQTKHIILDGSLSRWRKDHYKAAFDSIGIPVIALEERYHQIYL